MKGHGKTIRDGSFFTGGGRHQEEMPELDLHRLRAHIAETRIQSYMLDKMRDGVPAVRIIHGHGEGVMEDVAKKWIEAHQSAIASTEPGNGFIVVRLKRKR
jgi:DNA-nicking Smr family endonuclease